MTFLSEHQKQKLMHRFPSLDQVHLVVTGENPDKARSLWLGVSQVFLNLPRLIILGIIRFLVVAVFSVVSVLWLAFLDIVIGPIIVLYIGIYGGWRGRFVDVGAVSQGMETCEFFSLKHGFLKTRANLKAAERKKGMKNADT